MPDRRSSPLIFQTLREIPEESSGIYALIHTPSGRMYIGGTCDIAARCKQHIAALRYDIHCNPILQEAWTRDGPRAFHVCVLEPIIRLKDLLKREKRWMERLNTVYPNGFNRRPVRDTSIPPNRANDYLRSARDRRIYWERRQALMAPILARREAWKRRRLASIKARNNQPLRPA